MSPFTICQTAKVGCLGMPFISTTGRGFAIIQAGFCEVTRFIFIGNSNMVAFLTLHRLGFKISLQEFFTAFKTFQAANGINSYSWRGFSFLSGEFRRRKKRRLGSKCNTTCITSVYSTVCLNWGIFLNWGTFLKCPYWANRAESAPASAKFGFCALELGLG